MGLSKRKCSCTWQGDVSCGLPVRVKECGYCCARRMAKDPRESTVEGYLVEKVEAAGGLCEKFMTGESGPPDRIITWHVLLGCGRAIQFVELKKLGKKPETPQKRDHRRRRALGQMVFVLDSKEQVDWYLEVARFFTWAEYIAHCRAQGEL